MTDPTPRIADLIARKRDGLPLDAAALRAIAEGLARRGVSDAQAGAFAMAVMLRGLSPTETVDWTLALRDSGRVLAWRGIDRPVLDKHSTGGVGDTVSLMLGPMLAACGACVPMISGRGLGHTGGTLDKLEALPGYTVRPTLARLRRVVRDAGVAIVGAGADLAPADRRLYAVRDVTATVASAPLIVGSILSKKLAAGLQGLVMDVKVGNGAFLPGREEALNLAQQLVAVGRGAGLPTRAWLTPMDQPLAPSAGNALEVKVAVDYLTGRARPPRLHAVTMALAAEAMVLGGLARDAAHAAERLQAALERGDAAECWARMVQGLGGPANCLGELAGVLPVAPVQRAALAPDPGGRGVCRAAMRVAAIDARLLGDTVVRLGGGRAREADAVDPRVGLSHLAAVGDTIEPGSPLGIVHAATDDAADTAVAALRRAYRLVTPQEPTPQALVGERIDGAA
jgi:thymidine phosphorylase